MSHPAPIKTHQCYHLALRMKQSIHHKAFLHLAPTYLTYLQVILLLRTKMGGKGMFNLLNGEDSICFPIHYTLNTSWLRSGRVRIEDLCQDTASDA